MNRATRPPGPGLHGFGRRGPATAELAAQLIERLGARNPQLGGMRQSGEQDLLSWGRQFLPAYFREPPSTMHRWLGEHLDAIRRRRGGKLNVLAPRGSAKSTVSSLCYALRCAVEATEPYIWILSATRDQAQTHLENLKAELEHNWRLAAAYPGAVGRGPAWRASSLELVNGVFVEAYGAGQQLRGRRRREHRPSLIICDDLENDLRAASGEQRAACRAWFDGVVLKAGDEGTNVVNLATALHRDALAMRLHRSAGWTSALFRAVQRWPVDRELWERWEALYSDAENPAAAQRAREFFLEHEAAMAAGAELLWPEKEDLYSLMRMRVDGGRSAFEREKQNSPIDPERCEWPEEYFDHHIWFREWPADLAVRTVALDPSKGGDARHGDYSAFALVGVDAHGVVFVEADLARRPTPQMVQDGVSLCLRFRPDAFGVEANQFQELLADELVAEFRRRKKPVTRPYAIHNYAKKQVRIRKLGPYLAQRRMRFLARSASTRLLVDQLRDFPLGDHDDGPDALEMALRLADELLNGYDSTLM